MVTYFVTGGSGFIGSALIRKLFATSAIKENIKVINIDKLTYAASPMTLKNVEGNYKFIKADICDQRLMADLLKEYRPQGVFHLAAESHVDRSIDHADVFIQTNINGTYSLLSACREFLQNNKDNNFRFLHVSTDEVYGSLGKDGLFNENTKYDPRSPYSASKASSDHLVMAWYHSYGLPVLMTNCSNNYGPYQFPEKLIPLMIINALNNRPLPIYGQGNNIRDWLHVDDHVEALIKVMQNGRVGEKYNIGGRNEKTNQEVVEVICQLVDNLLLNNKGYKAKYRSEKDIFCKDLITYVRDRPGHDLRYAIDPSKIEKELKFVPKYNFDTGIKQTIAWYIDNEDWWKSLIDISQVRLGLGKN